MEVEVQPVLEPDESCAAQGPRALCCAGATVPVFNEDTEAPVLGQQQWEAVHERRARGQSISAISRELELDRRRHGGDIGPDEPVLLETLHQHPKAV